MNNINKLKEIKYYLGMVEKSLAELDYDTMKSLYEEFPSWTRKPTIEMVDNMIKKGCK